MTPRIVHRARLPKALTLFVIAATAVLIIRPAAAIIPVTDIGAIIQLINQIHTMEQQLLTARSQLTQAQSTLTAMTGSRGMQGLLANTPRNYLPADYQQLTALLQGATASYASLSSQAQGILQANAVLSTAELARFSPTQRSLLDGARREAATLDVLTRGALANTSGRFAALQQLISAIGTAGDQKAILDLQARIGAEQGMLQNEATKLNVLYQSGEAQRQVRAQRVAEQGIADVGSLRALPPLGLTVSTAQ